MNSNCVYILILKNKYFYVGSTGNFKNRLKNHLFLLKNNTHFNKKFNEYWNIDKEIKYSIIDTNNREEAYQLEDSLINRYRNSPIKDLLLNISSSKGYTFEQRPNFKEFIKNMANYNKIKAAEMSPEQRKLRYSKGGFFGKTHSTESRLKISVARKNFNEVNGIRKGFKINDVQKKTLSDHAKERIGNKNPFFGKTHSEEWRKRKSLERKGCIPKNRKQTSINGIIYSSASEASKSIGIPMTRLTKYLKNNTREGWFYV